MDDIVVLLSIIALGYLIGNIKIKGIGLGTSGVLLIALLFGHFQYQIDPIIGDLGLLLFIGSVGFISGPKFLENFKNKAYNYIILGFIVVLIGGVLVVISQKLFDLPIALSLGLFSGALTSTPALGSGVDATGGDPLVATGYGIAYIFGVICVVFFVQLLPKFIKDDSKQKKEGKHLDTKRDKSYEELIKLDPINLSIFAIAMVLGIYLGKVKIPIYKKLSISLGLTGGPLVMAIIFGHIGNVGRVDLTLSDRTLSIFRELGLVLFLTRTGLQSGQGFVEVLQNYGIMLFLIGIFMTLLPMIVAYLVGRKVLNLNLFDTLGTITGAMTSTPALGALLEASNNNEYVGLAYASTYPVALIFLVIIPQLIIGLFG